MTLTRWTLIAVYVANPAQHAVLLDQSREDARPFAACGRPLAERSPAWLPVGIVTCSQCLRTVNRMGLRPVLEPESAA